MNSIHVKINGIDVEVPSGSKILDAAEIAGIEIPTLCHLKDITPGGACRMCVVEVKGMAGLQAACTTACRDGMEIETDSEAVRVDRKINLELICANHRMDCTWCNRFPYCELQNLSRKYGIDDRKYKFSCAENIDDTARHLIRDESKCILCGRCAAACKKQGIQAIGVAGRGKESRMTPGACEITLNDTECIGCGQCITVCPTGALQDKNSTREVYKALTQKKKYPIVLLEPEVLVELGECMLDEPGTTDPGKIAAMLRKIGFQKVISLARFRETALDQTTGVQSFCPAVIGYCRKHYPDVLLVRSYPMERAAICCYEELCSQSDISEEEIYITGVTTCTAMKAETLTGVDKVITVRELAAMIRRFCISNYTALDVWKKTQPEEFDTLTCERTDIVSADNGVTGFREVCKVLAEAEFESDQITLLYACPGGCLYGGGQPRHYANIHTSATLKEQRQQKLEVLV